MRFIFIILLTIVLASNQAKAGLIRDAQIEQYLGELTKPIAEVAEMNYPSMRIFIVGDSRINAFVTQGTNIFINTGLIIAAKNPEMIMGVLAHEMGHITSGHVIQTGENIKAAQAQMIMSYLLGVAAAAAGSGDVGAALISGGGHLANRGFLAHTRSNEQTADQAAIRFLDSLKITSKGMLEMFERLRAEEKRQISGQVDSYAFTHPLSKERITHIRAHLQQTEGKYSKLSEHLQREHKLVKAKLIGYLDEPQQVLQEFPQTDGSEEARIARAYAKMRISLFNEALDEINPLIEAEPNNGYLHETKGSILYEARRYDEAILEYAKAREILANSALIRSDYAKAIVASGRNDLFELAKTELIYSSEIDPTYQPTWRSLAQIYGKGGEIGMGELCLSEIAALNQQKTELIAHLDRAEKLLPADAQIQKLRLEDLRRYAKTLEDETVTH